MADENRMVFPDEAEEIKAKALEDQTKVEEKSGEPDSADEPPTIQVRNMITAPPNCPPGFKRGEDGVCREMADENRMVFPDETEEINTKAVEYHQQGLKYFEN